MSGEESPWVRVIKCRYLSFMNGSSSENEWKKWSLRWRDLHSSWWSRVDCLFMGNLSLSIGNGSQVRFWSDPWVESRVSLKVLFSCLYRLPYQKDDLVREVFLSQDDCWILKWQRFPNAVEFHEFADFWNCSCRYKLKMGAMDSWIWSFPR